MEEFEMSALSRAAVRRMGELKDSMLFCFHSSGRGSSMYVVTDESDGKMNGVRFFFGGGGMIFEDFSMPKSEEIDTETLSSEIYSCAYYWISESVMEA